MGIMVKRHLSIRLILASLTAGLVLPVLSKHGTATGEAVQTITLAASSGAADWPALLQSRDPALQDALRARLTKMGLAREAKRGKLAVALVDITDPTNPRMAAINAHRAMYAASLPKIAILLGAFQKHADGHMELTPAHESHLTSMIRRSSNTSATYMLETVGFDYLHQVLESDRYKLYDPSLNGGLWVGKAYAKKGAWKRDPINNLSHAATVFEVARFYYLLETGRLVSDESSLKMKTMLADPAIKHKFVLGLSSHRPDARIYRKSGTWRTYHADSAVVERDGRRYIAVALADSPTGGAWLSKLIVAMDDLVFSPENVAKDRTQQLAQGASSR